MIKRRVKDYPRTIAFIVAILAFVVAIYAVSNQAQKNKEAIEKGCILLNNAILRSSASSVDPESASAALVAGILTVIPAKYVKEFKMRSQQHPTVIPLIDCKKVANDPKGIKADPIPRPINVPTVSIPPQKR